MNTYILLLRAVNVSGKNKIKMSELVSILSQSGYESVKTYIQSGNIILRSHLAIPSIQENVQELIHLHFGLTIYVFVIPTNEFEKILKNNPYADKPEKNKVFITLLNFPPELVLIDKFTAIDFGSEEYMIIQNVLYFYIPAGMSNSKLSNSFIENKLKVISTGINLNTINQLQELIPKN